MFFFYMFILNTLQEGDVLDLSVRFGKECVEIDCWTKRKQYDSLCQVLGSGVNQQLQVKNLQSKS